MAIELWRRVWQNAGVGYAHGEPVWPAERLSPCDITVGLGGAGYRCFLSSVGVGIPAKDPSGSGAEFRVTFRIPTQFLPGFDSALRPVIFAIVTSLIRLIAFLFVAGSAAAGEAEFDLRYEVRLAEDSDTAEVAMTLGQEDSLVESFRFRVDPARQAGFAGDGRIESDDPFVTWFPPEDGGRLEWTVKLPHRRNKSGYDSWVGDG